MNAGQRQHVDAFGVTLFGILLTPVFFYVARCFTDRGQPKPELSAAKKRNPFEGSQPPYRESEGCGTYRSLAVPPNPVSQLPLAAPVALFRYGPDGAASAHAHRPLG
jgi:hypothetical protein